MIGGMRLFSKFVFEMTNSKLRTTLPPPIRFQEKWKFCIWDCPIFVESNRTVPNSTKMTISITILLGAFSSNGIGGTTINYAWLNSSNIILCFLDIAEAQFRCGWKRELFLSVSSKILFLEAIMKTPLQIVSGSSLQGDVLFKVLIDNCVVLLVNVYAVFISHAGLTTLLTLANKQITLPLWI